MNIKVGSQVRVIDSGEVYLRYRDFIDKYKSSATKPWHSDMEKTITIRNGDIGIVESINKHTENPKLMVAIVNTDEYSFMMNVRGLENILQMDLDILKIVKEEKYYIETNLGRFDITEQMENLLNK